MTTATTYKLGIYFPELQDDRPAPVLWTASSPQEALEQVKKEYPDCVVVLCP